MQITGGIFAKLTTGNLASRN